MVLQGIHLEMNLGLVFWSNLHLNHLQMTKCYPRSKAGRYTYTNQLTNLGTIILYFVWEALQFEATGPQLCTFLMDLHPPTHVQHKIPAVYV